MQLRVIWHAPQAQGNFMCDIGDGRLIGDDCFVAFSSTRETRTFVENREHNVADDLGKHYAWSIRVHFLHERNGLNHLHRPKEAESVAFDILMQEN